MDVKPYWDSGLAGHDTSLPRMRSRVRISPIPPASPAGKSCSRFGTILLLLDGGERPWLPPCGGSSTEERLIEDQSVESSNLSCHTIVHRGVAQLA